MGSFNPEKRIVDWVKTTNPYDNEIEDEEHVEIEDDGLSQLIPIPMQESKIDLMSEQFRILDKKFDLWTIHTNFYLTKEVVQCMKFTPGIEIFMAQTPYRALLAIGKCFDKEQVSVIMNRRLNMDKILDE